MQILTTWNSTEGRWEEKLLAAREANAGCVAVTDELDIVHVVGRVVEDALGVEVKEARLLGTEL